MSITTVERHNSLKASSANVLKIRPYIGVDDNMGLSSQGLVMFEGAMHEEPVACTEINGVINYITGLNEASPSVQNILDEKERASKIKNIRETVAELEFRLTSRKVDPAIKNHDFWQQVELLHPKNSAFWEKIVIRIDNKGLFLDMQDPNDVIKYFAIKAGGFSTVAGSLKIAEQSDVKPKFFLDEAGESAAAKVEVKKIRNKALGLLDELVSTKATKLMYVAKAIDIDSAQYRKTTPIDVLYDNMDEFINGRSFEKSSKRASQKFIKVAEMDQKEVMVRAIIKDATFYRELSLRPDGLIYHMKSNSALGKNIEDVVEHLKNPLNEEIAVELQRVVEKYWNT
jgi:hypothetical protein